MGYRLEVSELIPASSGSKLYGYIPNEDVKKLKSHKWLLDRGYINGDEYWSYGCNPQVVLDRVSFKEFMHLYAEDWFDTYNMKFWLENFDELMESDNFKILEWF